MTATIRDFVEDLSIASAVQYVGESARAIDTYMTSRTLTPTQQRFLSRAAALFEQWEMAALDLHQGTYSPELSLTLTAVEAAGHGGAADYEKMAGTFRGLSTVCRDLQTGTTLDHDKLQQASEELAQMRLALLRRTETCADLPTTRWGEP